MEYKDIINLFVPIIFNGIILFLFQKVINERFQKNSVKEQMKKKIYEDYFVILQKINYFVHITMENEVFNSGEAVGIESISEELLGEYLFKLKALCNELNAYYMTYKAFLCKEDKIKDRHKELITNIDEYVKRQDVVGGYNKTSDSIEDLTDYMVEVLLKA